MPGVTLPGDCCAKAIPRPAVEAALERIPSLGLLDDAAYARNYVQTRAARGRGPARLTRDLLAMGVERSLIDRALDAEWPEGSDRTRGAAGTRHGSGPRSSARCPGRPNGVEWSPIWPGGGSPAER